jgi:hypothetical protein
MNPLFHEELVCRYLAGEASAEDRRHLSSCAACRVECERCDRAFSGLRTSVRNWSDAEYSARPFNIAGHKRQIPGAVWILCFLLLMTLAAVKLLLVEPAEPVSTAERDAALLDYVRVDVARVVPVGMEPLMTVVSPSEEGRR